MAYLYIIKVVVLPTATATFAKSNETFSVDIEEKSPERKGSISGNCIIVVNILLVVFLV